MAPAALAAVTATFVDPRERARAFSIFGAIASAGGALGLLLGGLLTEHLDWRWTLYVNLAIAAITLIGALAFLDRDAPTQRDPIDLLGTALVTAGLFGAVFGFSRAETNGWTAPITWATLAVSAVLLVVFSWWQTRAAHPLLPLRIVLDRERGASLAALMIINVGLFAVFLFLTYYLQTSWATPRSRPDSPSCRSSPAPSSGPCSGSTSCRDSSDRGSSFPPACSSPQRTWPGSPA